MSILTTIIEPAFVESTLTNAAIDESFYEANAASEYEPGEFEKLLAESLDENEVENEYHNEQIKSDEVSDYKENSEAVSHTTVFNDTIACFVPVQEFIQAPLEEIKFTNEVSLSIETESDSFELNNIFINKADDEAAAAFFKSPEIDDNLEKLEKAAVTFSDSPERPEKPEKAAAAFLEVNVEKDAGKEGVFENVNKTEAAASADEAVPEKPGKAVTENIPHFNSGQHSDSRNSNDNSDLNQDRRDRFSVQVRDLRTGAGKNASARSSEVPVSAATPGASSAEAPVREITLELKLPDGQNPVQNASSSAQTAAQTSSQTSWEAGSGGAHLENLLARELHNNFNGDIVRHASMALKDGGEGFIRLALKPDTLGNVKIALDLSENKITGRIVVESEEAFNAFKKEIASLEQAFKDSGYTEANLDLSFAGEDRNAAGEQNAKLFLPVAASRYDDYSLVMGVEQDTTSVNAYIGQRPGVINILA